MGDFMTDIAGTCSSKTVSQTTIGMPGQAERQLGVMMTTGQHASRGTPWDDARLTYVGTSDVSRDGGQQRGYFHNVHTDGAISEGTFEAKVSMPDGVLTLEGTWTFTGGSGSLTGIKGGGVLKANMTSTIDSEMTWSGSYQL